MMDKKPHIKPYLYGMLAGFGAISLSILFFFLIYRFQGFGDAISKLTGILMPFIYGAVIAYLLKPVCNCVEDFLRRLLPEKMGTAANMLAVTVSLLFGILVVYALIMMIVPQLITSVTTLYYTARNNLNDFVDWASHQEIIASNQKLLDFIETSYDNLQDTLDNIVRTKLVPSMQSLLSGAALGVMSFVTFLKNIIIGVIVSVYLLASRKKFGQQGKMILYSLIKPRWADIILEEILYADKMFGGFINGKILDSAIIGVICYFGCLILHIPDTILVAVIIGVTNVIPVFGPFIGAIPSLLLVVIQSPLHALYLLIFIIVLQQVDGNIIGPKILGDSTGLSAFWVMFSILIGGGLFGFLGMLLGVPVFAMIYYIIRRLVNHSIRKKNLTTVTEAYVEAAGVDEATGAIIYYGEKQKKKRTLKDSGKKDETKKNQ